MRVTNGIMSQNLLNNLNHNMERMDENSRQLSTGKKFNLPSQDPTGVVTSMNLNTTISNKEQYLRNAGEGITWIRATDSAFDQATKVIQRAREITIRGKNDSLSSQDKKAIADEVMQLRGNLKDVANTNQAGRYIFSGQKTTTEPYPTSDSPYQGDEGNIEREISNGVDMAINEGGAFFKGMLDDLKEFADALNANDTAEFSIEKFDKKIDEMLTKRSEIGAKQKRLELTENRLSQDRIKFKGLLSKNEDVDIAETIMNLKMAENVYRAALSTGARIIQPSLMDFLG